MAELLSGELLHMEPAHLITLAESETAAARLQSSSAVLELGKQLLHAAREGNTTEVLALMSKGAPFTTDWLGTSPLHLAAMNAHEETCSVLLRAGISRDTRTKVERTPLHLAAYEGHASLCSLLLDHGAQHDSRDMLQMTPLHWAVERGHRECARVLLQAGADPHAACKFLRTPLSMATAAGDAQLLQLMQQALLDRLHRESEASARAIHHPDPEPVNQMEVEEDPLLAEESDAAEAEAAGGRAAAAGAGSAHRLVKMLSPQTECSAATEALLRRHGIAMLPADNSNTLISALQSGRRVVLSDAGKLMLKESEGSSPRPAAAGAPAPAPAEVSAAAAAAAALAPAPAATKITRIFTINGNQLLPVQRARAGAAAVEGGVRVRRAAVLPHPAARAPVPARAPLAAGRLIPLKVPSSQGGGVAETTGVRRGAVIDLEQLRSLQREGVLKLRSAGDGRKILIHRNSFGRLTSAALRTDHQARDTATLKYTKLAGGGEVSERVTAGAEAPAEADEVVRLRAELSAARSARAELEREVRSLRRRLLLYEPASAAD